MPAEAEKSASVWEEQAMTNHIYLYILVAAAVSFLIRVLPLTLIRKKIKNRFIRSFLYYVPYVTLAVMTFPAIITAPQLPAAGILALIVGVAAAWRVSIWWELQLFAAVWFSFAKRLRCT